MKIKFYLSVCLVFVAFSISFAQRYAMYPEAPEKWSKPEPVFNKAISDSFDLAEEPSVTADGKTLYFDYIFVTHLTDTGWSMPKRLPKRITNPNAAGVDHPIISPDGKRLFFDWYLGGWYLLYCDWDSTTNDWGPVTDPGPPVDNPHPYWGAAWGCGPTAGCLLDDTSLIYTLCGETFITHRHKATATWDTAVSWPYIFPNSTWDGLRFAPSGYGIAVTPDRKKVYLGGDSGFDTTNVPWNVDNFNLVVYYRDTTDTTDLLGYGKPYILNISLMSDSLYRAGIYKGLFEAFPSITADGRTLFFEANYDSNYTIYVSHLLVDENGDTVTSVSDKHPAAIPNGYKLLPAYPNPFNPTTTITYSVPFRSRISLEVYDILGRKIRTLAKEVKSSGEYNILFNGKGLASGTYLIILETPKGVLSRKITLIK